MWCFQTIHSAGSVLGKNGKISLEYLSSACGENEIGINNYSGPDIDKLHKEFYGKHVSTYVDDAFFDYGHYEHDVFLYEHDASHCASFGRPSIHDSNVIKDERIFIGDLLAQINWNQDVSVVNNKYLLMFNLRNYPFIDLSLSRKQL